VTRARLPRQVFTETTRIPSTQDPNNIIAPFWTDFENCGTIHSFGDQHMFVVEWRVFLAGQGCGDTAFSEVGTCWWPPLSKIFPSLLKRATRAKRARA
jgi:hypothetical protein